MKRKKRHGGARLLGFLILLALVWVFSTFTLSVTEVTVRDSRIKDEIKIVQITDLHGASFGSGNSALIKKIRQQSPDMVCATGDMYTSGDDAGEATALSLLAELAREFPVYYVSGEHDGGEAFLEGLAAAGVRLLNYSEDIVTVGDTEIHLYGIDNAYYSPTFDLANEFEPDSGRFSVLLAHISNFERFSAFGIDLTLSGDTHGGQVRIPFVGALIHDGVWFPEVNGDADGDIKYTKGLYDDGESYLFVSGGLGNYPVPLRLFNRPEIAVITLAPELG